MHSTLRPQPPERHGQPVLSNELMKQLVTLCCTCRQALSLTEQHHTCILQDFSTECGICYAYRFNDEVPDQTCDDSHCVQTFHSSCLVEVVLRWTSMTCDLCYNYDVDSQCTCSCFWGLLRLCHIWWKSIKKCDRESADCWQRDRHAVTEKNWIYNLSLVSDAICYSYGADNNTSGNVYRAVIMARQLQEFFWFI